MKIKMRRAAVHTPTSPQPRCQRAREPRRIAQGVLTSAAPFAITPLRTVRFVKVGNYARPAWRPFGATDGTPVMNVRTALNRQFPCPVCKTESAWRSSGAVSRRANSTIHWFACCNCGLQVLAKEAGDSAPDLRREFDTLNTLHRVLPDGETYRTVTPFACLELESCTVLIAERIRGADLQTYVRQHGSAKVMRSMRAAGTLLKALHMADPNPGRLRPLDVDDKLEYLSEEYGSVLHQSRIGSAALAAMSASAKVVRRPLLPYVWSHTDYKPANLVYDGQRVATFDTHMINSASYVYDLAYFLTHLGVAVRVSLHGDSYGTLERLEAAFVAGYGPTDPTHRPVLDWTRLYSALCQLGSYARRGRIMHAYGEWLLRPQVKVLIGRLHLEL